MRRHDLTFPPKDEPLRQDVSTLGALVGEVIAEQGGRGLYERVEAARRSAIDRREGDEAAGRELSAQVEGLAPAAAEALVRAFSTYFRVVNLAEQIHRIRRRRDYLKSGTPQRGSWLETLGRLRDGGLTRDELTDLLASLAVEPVFTAHPTEATRRAILEKEQALARYMVARLDPSLTPPEEARLLAQIRREVTIAWQTDEHPSERPRVEDELGHVLFYLTDVLYRVVPPFYEDLEQAITDLFGATTSETGEEPPPRPRLLSFASWVGGDMDGNPNVTARTFEATLERQRQAVLGRYRQDVGKLAKALTQSLSRVAVDRELRGLGVRYAGFFPQVFESIPERHRQMPYRVLLTLMAERLAATRRDEPTGYPDAGELTRDLERIADSLARHQGEHAGRFEVERLITRVAAFGFHLATVDLRQDAAVHRRVAGRLFGDEDWEALPDAERRARLSAALLSAEPPRPVADFEVEATLDVFRAVGRARERYGAHAVGPFVVSMTQGADDVLTVLLLARWAGLAGETAEVPLDVAPLFETVPDLEAAPRVMAELLADPVYRRHLATRGDRQMVMIGYSDSSKRAGMAASRWALHRAQEELVAVLGRAGVVPTFFHGRGGTVSRGGGKTHRAVLAAPAGAVAGRLRVTEQGEVIHDKYGLRGIALRTLERTAGAVALATARPAERDPREPVWRRVMDDLAAAARRSFRALVHDDPELPEYFRRATPIDVIERMRIGSRPASRRSGRGIEDLRAIPWVFAWTQSRHLLPGWYGLGTGLAAATDEHGEETLAAMAREWPFLQTLLADAEMVLAKADLAVARRYAALAGEIGERLFPRIREEHERTVERVLRLQGTSELLDGDPALARSIRLRNPYVDPMSLLQVDLLARWREGDRQDDDLFRALVATVQGIAQGLRNTG